MLTREAGKASGPSWLTHRGNTTHDAAQDAELILYLDLLAVCLLPSSLPVCEQVSDPTGTNPSADVSPTSREAHWWLLAGEPLDQAESIQVSLKHAGGPFNQSAQPSSSCYINISSSDRKPALHKIVIQFARKTSYQQEQHSAEGERDYY